MSETVETKADTAVGNKTAVVKKKAPKTARRVEGVKVKNISDRIINTSIGSMKPGEEGRATLAETHSYSKFLEVL